MDKEENLSNKKNKKEKAVSLLDLHKGVQDKITEMQRVNREKSKQKIQELSL